MSHNHAAVEFRAARDRLVTLRERHEDAVESFVWPDVGDTFNWAIDWFDTIARDNPREALVIAEEDGSTARFTFDEMATRSDRVGGWLRRLGVTRGDAVMLMLGNQVELWDSMLAIMKLGAVILPTTTALGTADLIDRLTRGRVRHVIAAAADLGKFDDVPGDFTRIRVGAGSSDWLDFADAFAEPSEPLPHPQTAPNDPLLLYFTSGTTSRPKLVEHTQVSYPVGHLTTMYWLGLRAGDIHLAISSPGWAKHAWSCFFAPWIAEATIFVYNYARFDASSLLQRIRGEHVTSFCAPPTVWRMLIQSDLSAGAGSLREAISAGEPLNPEVIHQVRSKWGLTIRDGYGQTEMTAVVGNTPGSPVKDGSMGRPLPGCPIVLVDPLTGEVADEGEICVDLSDRPVNLMTGYVGDPERNAAATHEGYFHTGDIASRDDQGTSPTSAEATTSSRRPTTRSARSNWRVCSSSIRRSPRPRSCPPRMPCGSRFRRPTSCSRPASSPRPRPLSRSWSTPASSSRRSSGSVASSSWNFRRLSRERSAGSNSESARRPSRSARSWPWSGGTTNSPA